MSYFTNALRMVVNTFIPFGDKIPGMQENKAVISKNQEKARLATGHRIKNAIKEGKIDSSLESAANKMIEVSKKNLAAHNTSDYLWDQVAKSSSVVDWIIPGSGVAASVVATTGKAKNLKDYADQTSYLSPDTLKRCATKVALPAAIIVGLPVVVSLANQAGITPSAAMNVVANHVPGMNFLQG